MNNKIKIELAIKNITQEDLANLVGVTRQTINAIEKNKYNPSAVLAYKISKVFGKTIEEVFDFSDEK
jgi:putative transcriptional regulator